MDGSLSSLKFCAGILVGPEFIADSYRAVFCCSAPITSAAGLQGDGPVQIAHARYSGGWVLRVVGAGDHFAAALNRTGTSKHEQRPPAEHPRDLAQGQAATRHPRPRAAPSLPPPQR